MPTGAIRWPNVISSSPESAATKKNVQTEFWLVDEDYVNTLGMEIIQGRNFSSAFLSDSSSIIVNETAAKMLGYTGNKPQTVYNNNKAYNIIGIVKDFNFSSLKDNVTPLVMIMGQNWNMSLSVRVTADNLPALIRQIEAKWRKFVPDQQMDYSFMDDDFSAMYRAEQRMGKISLIFTSLAIAVACMGLLGLVTYVAEQRRKEISIRKVLGANLAIIMTLLSKDFLRLILIAFLVSSPIAWFATHRWLDNYAYRINVQWWMFAAAGSFALLIAFITISFQSVKAALMNPVKSLRSE